jgi:putative ABC transport system ATP-binding protein
MLQVHNLIKSFASPAGGRVLVVDVPEFSLAAGEQCALEGASGSGKTTFLHLLAGILTPDEGRISVAGRELTRLSESSRDALRAVAIGYIFQTFNLLQGYSALENVELAMQFGRGPDRKRARLLLEQVGLGGRMSYRPAQLSIGQQQRVAVARALANRPAVVLADEPTGNLDRAKAGDSIRLIREVCAERGATLLVVSHDPFVLDQFERRASMTDLNRAAAGATGEAA